MLQLNVHKTVYVLNLMMNVFNYQFQILYKMVVVFQNLIDAARKLMIVLQTKMIVNLRLNVL